MPSRRHLMLAAALAALPAAAQATAVDLRLVLCVDASGSITDEEFRLQREGYAEAFEDERLIASIRSGVARAIAVTYLEWGSPGGARVTVPWMRVGDAAGAEAFADAVLAAPRTPQSYNAIGDALVLARQTLAACPFPGGRGVIDVSGDGPDMRSLVAAPVARDAIVAAGHTINALAIGTRSFAGDATLADIYRRDVIGGPGAFVIEADDYVAFKAAIFNKLFREIA
jgi:hypothetical protein